MPIPDRIKVVLLDEGTISHGGLERVAQYASEVVLVGERRRGDVKERLGSLGVPVTVQDGRADIESAMRTAARSGAIVVATGRPAKAEKLIRDAVRGAAGAVDHGLPAVGLIVLGEHDTRSGTVFTVTDTGELSGYEPLFALGVAEHLGREVVMLAPPGRIKGPRTDVLNHAERLASEAGISWTEASDPSPITAVIAQSESAAGAIIGVLEVPTGPSWLGSRPSLKKGNPHAAVSLIEEAACDVMVVFDGVHLTHESMSKDQAAAILGLGLVATGAAAAAVTPASAMLGHVTRSITQQARTYRSDIGASDSDSASTSGSNGQDTKRSDTKSDGSTAKKAPKASASATTTAHTSKHSSASDSDSATSVSRHGSTRSTHHVSERVDLNDFPAPAPRAPDGADGLRDGVGGHDPLGHSCDRGHSGHCDHPSHIGETATTTTGTNTSTGTTTTTTGTGTPTETHPTITGTGTPTETHSTTTGNQPTDPPKPYPTPIATPHQEPHLKPDADPPKHPVLQPPKQPVLDPPIARSPFGTQMEFKPPIPEPEQPVATPYRVPTPEPE
ncbi:hypothetical protein GR927_34480, partial [Mycolicibacterium sp. 3033]|nr:hypothetical protein [Mycolicibacterium aurantiacum]